MLRKPQAEEMIELKGILKLMVWRLKVLNMLAALVKDCLLAMFVCISE